MVNIYKLKLTNLQQEILRLLSVRAGIQLNQRKISKDLEVSQTAVMKALPGLEGSGMIRMHQDKESRRWSVSLNRENPKTTQIKRADNLRMIYEVGLADLLEKEFAGATIIVFGSYSRGEDIVSSDIDIAVIGRKEKDVDLSGFEKMLERKINLIFFGSFKEVHKNLRENLFNGIVIAGSVEL